MSLVLDWRKDEDAPTPGAVIGPSERFAEDGAHFADLGDFPLLLVRRGEALTAFWNICPHQFLPLNWRSATVLGADGTTIRCSNHDAAFRIEDGAPVEGGPPVSCGLSQVPVRVENGAVVIGEG